MTAKTQALVDIQVLLGEAESPVSIANKYAIDTTKPRMEASSLSELIASLGPIRAGRMKVRVDSITGSLASLTTTVTGTSIAAAETITFVFPDGDVVAITAVASGADNYAGQFNTSATAATCATNIANCINRYSRTAKWITAATSGADLTITAEFAGEVGNTIRVVDGSGGLSASGYLAGGYSAARTSRGTMTVTTNNNLTNSTDTFTVGSVVFTWRTSASTQSEVTIGVDATASAANMVAKINAHTSLSGLVSATSAAGVVTIEYLGAPAAGNLLYLAVSDATAMSATAMSSGTTVAFQQTTRTYSLGASA